VILHVKPVPEQAVQVAQTVRIIWFWNLQESAIVPVERTLIRQIINAKLAIQHVKNVQDL